MVKLKSMAAINSMFTRARTLLVVSGLGMMLPAFVGASEAPRIDSISPSQGLTGDTVEVRGDGFDAPSLKLNFVFKHDLEGNNLWPEERIEAFLLPEVVDASLVRFEVPRVNCPDTWDCIEAFFPETFGVYTIELWSKNGRSNIVEFTLTDGSSSDGDEGYSGLGDNDGSSENDSDSGDKGSASDESEKAGVVLGATSQCQAIFQATGPDRILNSRVPAVVERLFGEAYGRNLTHLESVYWKMRARCHKPFVAALKGAMLWHYHHGSTGPAAMAADGTVAVFVSVYERQPTTSELAFWDGHEKQGAALIGAMQWHLASGIRH